MSTIKVDKISASMMPLPTVDGIGDLQTFVASSGQVQFTLTQFDRSSQIKVFVENEEATWQWAGASNTVITITAPVIPTGAKIRVYKVFGDIAYKPMSFFDAYALKTDNVASASKLQVARTINGVSFDGTQNITIADPSKLPLAGGTLTGALGFPNGIYLSGLTGSLGIATEHGYVAIGNSNTSYTYYTSSVGAHYFFGSLTAQGDIAGLSDARLKENVEVIPNALDKVCNLRGVVYDRIDTGARQTGLIAQEVLEVLPEAVIDNGEHLAVTYGNLVGLLVEAIKELREEVERLKDGAA